MADKIQGESQVTVGVSATEMLREDHEAVKTLFEDFEKGSGQQKIDAAEKALKELTIHTALEEELFYPAVRGSIIEEEAMDEAIEEHHVAELLIRELAGMRLEDERFEAKFKVLAESVKHHIQKEESEVLPKAEKGGVDLMQLGRELQERKRQLSRTTRVGRSHEGSRRSRISARFRGKRRAQQSLGGRRKRRAEYGVGTGASGSPRKRRAAARK